MAALKTRTKFSFPTPSAFQHHQMLEMLKELTPAERASLRNPEFITEDEADLIVSDRRAKEPALRFRSIRS